MYFYAEQDKLYKCLNVVEKALPPRTAMPVLKGVLLEAADGYLHMVANNLEMSIQAHLDGVKVVEKGKVVLPEKIVEIVRQLNDGEIKISMQEEEMRVEISSGNAVFVLYGMDTADYPEFVTEEQWHSWHKILFSASDFKEMFKKIIFAVSHDEGRPLFRAVHLSFAGGKLNIVGTDTYRLARVQRTYADGENLKNTSFLIPGRILNEIIKVLDDNQNEELACYYTENDIIFCYRQFIFSSRLVEGKYPEVSSVFPADFKTRIKVEREKLDRLLRRAVLLAHGQNQMIMLKISGNVLSVRASSESGKMDEELALADKEGEDLEEILLNARYFSDPLPVLADPLMTLEFNGPFGPCIFKRTQENGVREDYEYLVLPIKTDRRT